MHNSDGDAMKGNHHSYTLPLGTARAHKVKGAGEERAAPPLRPLLYALLARL